MFGIRPVRLFSHSFQELRRILFHTCMKCIFFFPGLLEQKDQEKAGKDRLYDDIILIFSNIILKNEWKQENLQKKSKKKKKNMKMIRKKEI